MGARPPSQFIQNDQRTLGRPGNDLWGFAQLLHECAASLEDVVWGSHPDEANIYTREFMNGGEPTVIHHYSPCESSCVGTPNTLDTAESLMIMSLIVCDFRVRGWLIQGIQIDFPSFLSLWFLCWQTTLKHSHWCIHEYTFVWQFNFLVWVFVLVFFFLTYSVHVEGG